MRTTILAVLATLALAACGESEPPKPAAVQPVKPLAQPAQTAAAAPAPAAPSADELLRERVTRALRDTRKVDGQGVDVTVAAGTVSLFGTAASEDARRAIERYVAGLDGVQAVVNKLVVVRGS
jgi:osmotically-inducible protein OsmY